MKIDLIVTVLVLTLFLRHLYARKVKQKSPLTSVFQ